MPSSKDKTSGNGLSDQAFDALRRKTADAIEPLSDTQLLELADDIHERLRQRRALRRHHVERMALRRLDMRI